MQTRPVHVHVVGWMNDEMQTQSDNYWSGAKGTRTFSPGQMGRDAFMQEVAK